MHRMTTHSLRMTTSNDNTYNASNDNTSTDSEVDSALTDKASRPQELAKKFPDFASATEGACELAAGEMLYLPAGWFHEALSPPLSLGPNTSRGGRASVISLMQVSVEFIFFTRPSRVAGALARGRAGPRGVQLLVPPAGRRALRRALLARAVGGGLRRAPAVTDPPTGRRGPARRVQLVREEGRDASS
jgi:hypothetical protein